MRALLYPQRTIIRARLRKCRPSQTSFRKDLKSLQKELDTLNKNKLTLNMDLSKAKRELKDAEKAFGAVGDEAARLRLEAAQADYDNIRQNLDLVSRTAKQTARDMDNLTGVVSKSENRMGGAGGTLATLAKAGLFSMAGNAAADLGGVLASSAFGSQTGNAITSVLGGAASGAAMGSVAGLQELQSAPQLARLRAQSRRLRRSIVPRMMRLSPLSRIPTTRSNRHRRSRFQVVRRLRLRAKRRRYPLQRFSGMRMLRRISFLMLRILQTLHRSYLTI